MTTPGQGHRRWLRRSGVATALAGLLAVLVAAAPTPAQAHDPVSEPFLTHCTPAAGLGDFHAAEPFPERWLFVFRIHSVTETFLKSEGQFAQNLTGSPQSVTFTSSVSNTFTMSTGFSFSTTVQGQIASGLTQQVTRGITVTVTVSTTTQIGVNVTATVPPMSTVQGDYGVRGFVIGVDMRVYHKTQCWLQGATGIFPITVPTVDQGWRVSIQPMSAANRPTLR